MPDKNPPVRDRRMSKVKFIYSPTEIPTGKRSYWSNMARKAGKREIHVCKKAQQSGVHLAFLRKIAVGNFDMAAEQCIHALGSAVIGHVFEADARRLCC